MNIFLLSNTLNPAVHYDEQAIFHCDKHVVKMIVESTQMLVTALSSGKLPTGMRNYIPDSMTTMPCKPLGIAMQKHPCTLWVCESMTNFNYLARLAWMLCLEHNYRYPLSPDNAYRKWLGELSTWLETDFDLWLDSPLPKHFAVAIKDADKRSTHTAHREAVALYRSYYVDDKAGFATWKRRGTPVWFLIGAEAKQAKAAKASKPAVYKF